MGEGVGQKGVGIHLEGVGGYQGVPLNKWVGACILLMNYLTQTNSMMTIVVRNYDHGAATI